MHPLNPARSLCLLAWFALFHPAGTGAQDTPRPPVAAPRGQPGSPDSAARERSRLREQAALDSVRRVMEARSESILRARRQVVGPPARPARSPLSGDPPFYGYDWVFYADLLVGAFIGWRAARQRTRNDPAGARVAWLIVGVLLGAAGGAAVFLPFFVMNAILSVGFSPMPPALLFGLNLGVMLLAPISTALSRRRG